MSGFYLFKVFSYLKCSKLNEFSDIKNICLHRAIQIMLASTTKLKKKYYTEEKREFSLFKELEEIMKIEFMSIGFHVHDKNLDSVEHISEQIDNKSKSSGNEIYVNPNIKTKIKNKKNKIKKEEKEKNNIDINQENKIEKDIENEKELENETGSVITTDDEGNEIIDLAKIKTTTPILNVGDVLLKCVKQGSKLRVKIISDGYFNDANCQFPKDIRKEGRIFKVKAKDVILAEGKAGKYFYRVKSGIEIYNEGGLSLLPSDITKIKIFEDKKDTDCAVCLSVPKTTVIVPCGHFYTCNSCARQLDKCPICRGGISKLIDKTNME